MKSKAEDFFKEKTKRIGTETNTVEKRIFERAYLPELQEKISKNGIKKVHITGVCGKATSSLAGLFAEAGYEVSGSDIGCYPPASDLINELGIKFYEGFSEEHVKDKDVIVVANMFGPDNVEGAFVREYDLPQLSMSEAIREFFIKDKQSIVVCGTHGKTTTTGLMSHTFIKANLHPGFLVGGVATPTDDGIQETSFSTGIKDNVESKYFIIEGDEYDTAYFDKAPKFLHYKPDIAVVTSLEFDHADIYADFEEYKQSFVFLAEEVPQTGCLVLNGDSPEVRELASYTSAEVLYYGIEGTKYKGQNNSADDVFVDVFAKNISVNAQGQQFDVSYKGQDLGRFSIQLFGTYNLYNTLAVIAVSVHEGLNLDEIKNGLQSFKGMKRRQEIRAVINDITIIDDFAHHPTAVRETLSGIRVHFPDQRIIAIFEPRSNTSRKKMFEHEYAHAFLDADQLYLSMPALRHNDNPADFIDGSVVVDEAVLNAKTSRDKDFYGICLGNGDEVIEKIIPAVKPGDVLVIMSNGSFDGIHEKLINRLEGSNL